MKGKQEPGYQRLQGGLLSLTRWLIPGLGVKRWFLLIMLGITLIAVGLAVSLLDFYRTAPDAWWLPLLSAVSLQFLARPLRAIIFGGLGISFIVFGIWELNRSLVSPFLRPGHHMVDVLRNTGSANVGHVS